MKQKRIIQNGAYLFRYAVLVDGGLGVRPALFNLRITSSYPLAKVEITSEPINAVSGSFEEIALNIYNNFLLPFEPQNIEWFDNTVCDFEIVYKKIILNYSHPTQQNPSGYFFNYRAEWEKRIAVE